MFSEPCRRVSPTEIFEHLFNFCYVGRVGSNPRPADHEKYGHVHRTHYLHGYHRAVPLMALIALSAQMARSTNRSTHSMVITGCQLQNVTVDRGSMLWALSQRQR
jgi:hypothetical protein